MSPEAIDRRLRDLGQPHKLWLSLREAHGEAIGGVALDRPRANGALKRSTEKSALTCRVARSASASLSFAQTATVAL